MARNDDRQLVSDWDELEAAGIPLEPLENRKGNLGSELTIRVGRPSWRSQIMELKNGSFAYILPIFIRRDLPGKTTILDCWLEPPWRDLNVELLGDPSEEGLPAKWYKLPGDSESFARDRILNHRVNCTLSRGDIRTGLLLWVGSPPPESYKNQSKIDVTFAILDQWDVNHSVKLEMLLYRRGVRPKEVYKSARGHLLSRRDVIVPSRRSFPAGPPAPRTKESLEKEEEITRRCLEEFYRARAEREQTAVPVEPGPGKNTRPESGSGSAQIDSDTDPSRVGAKMTKGS